MVPKTAVSLGCAAASLAFLRFPLGQIAALGLIGYALNFRWVGFGSRIHVPSISSPPASGLLPPGGVDAGVREISVLSHNVWCHYLQQWYAPSSSKRLAGLLASIESSNYDLVLIQELFIFRLGPFAVSDNFDQFVSGMRKLGYSHTTDPRPSVPMLGQNDGLAIFSKRPFVSQPVSESFTTTGELVCKKGFVHGAIKFGDSSLHVVTTHLDSKKKPKNVKELQVSQMSSALLPLFKGGCAIIAGDFNICSRGTKDDGASYKALKSGFSPLIDIYDGAEVASTRRPDTKPWARGKKKGKEGGAAIDHAFVMGVTCIDSNTIDIRCTDGTVVSDHLGMEFTLAARE